MTERKTCVRCGRPIDAYARACPFCNWDQSEAPPPKVETPSAQPAYAPPTQKGWQPRIIAAIAFVALVVIAFVIGTFIHGFDAAEVKAAQTRTAHNTTSAPSPRSNVTLVPVTENDAAPLIEQPITSAPPQAPGQQPNDATALPAAEYAAAAARAKALKKAAGASVDPRTITGVAYDAPPPTRRAEGEKTSTSAAEGSAIPESTPKPEPALRHAVERTDPVLEYRPVPAIRVDRDTTAQLFLTVGPDGRVKDIEIANTIPGESYRLIQAVQSWRFKPATENGIPVTARVPVDITIRANE